MKGWGYDYPYFDTDDKLKQAITTDFDEVPKNKGIHLFYNDSDVEITSKDANSLAEKALDWLNSLDTYSGN
jgi:hypothetical protein